MIRQWEAVLLSPSDSIRTALQKINDEALRIGIIVNEQKQLLGVVTDGDIRRGILNSIDLTSAVESVMNHNPITAGIHESKKQLINLMTEHGILAVPIIDPDTKKVVGLETLQNSVVDKKYKNPVFIMAGGFGTRLRPLTDNCPKPMLKVGTKPILETLLNQFSDAGFENIFISTHYMPEQITGYFGDGEKWGMSITYVHEDIPLGTGGALGLLPDDIPDLPLIMINGDVLTTLNIDSLLSFHERANGIATMCVREFEYQIPYGVVQGEGNTVCSMVEKPVQKFFVNAGIYVIEPEIFKNVPRQMRIDMPTLLEQKMSEGSKVMMFPVHEYWLDIGRMDDFNRAQNDISRLFK